MQKNKQSNNHTQKNRASKFRKMYRRFVWGILFYLRKQSPAEAIRYNENLLRLRVEVSDIEDRNLYLQDKVDNIEEQIEHHECSVAATDEEVGAPWVGWLENTAKLTLGIVPVIVLFQIFGISLADFGSSWQSKFWLIIIIVLVSTTIILLTSSLIIGAICYIDETKWDKKSISIIHTNKIESPQSKDENSSKEKAATKEKVAIHNFEFLSFKFLFGLFCIAIVLIEGFAGGYLASELIQGTARQENSSEIAKLSTKTSDKEQTKKSSDDLKRQLAVREEDISKHTTEVQTFMAILSSVNIAWSVIKGNKLNKTKTVRGKRSSSAKRVKILKGRMSKYTKGILANKKKIEALEKIIAKYWEDKDVKDTYTGTSRNNTAGQDYSAQYPPMPDEEEWFNDMKDFGKDDFDDEDDYEPDIDDEDGDREENTDGGNESDI